MLILNEIMKMNITSFADILLKKDEIIKAVRDNPIEDKVFIIPMYNNLAKDDTKYCIAGSAAMVLCHKLLKYEQLKLSDKSKLYGKFENTDTDIFFLDSPNSRVKCDNVDIVHVSEKTVEDLLLSFDLGCCRAALNDETETIWISMQCICSLLTGEYYLPSYLKNENEFATVFVNYNERKMVNLFNKLIFRNAKYESRGYTCKFFDTNVKLEWVNHRIYNNMIVK